MTQSIRTLRSALIVACSFLLAFLSFHIESALATGTFSAMSDLLSDAHAGQSGVNHSVRFSLATSGALQQVDIRFSTTSGGTTKPSGMNLASTTLGAVTNFGPDWEIDTSNAATGLLTLYRATPTSSIPSGTALTASLQNITNPALGDCSGSTDSLGDMCWVTVTTYSDAGTTAVDTGSTTYSIYVDPVLEFSIDSVNSGETHNGITTNVTSTSSTLPFGTLQPGSVRYVAHKLTVRSNAPRGYIVYAYLEQNITGEGYGGTISPFGAVNATWTTPQSWATPNGTSPNTNTGWIGANTSDTRVNGWTSGSSGKFGPISTVRHPVAYSSGADVDGTTVYVTYGLGVNGSQPSDLYTGNIIYDVQASY